MSTQSTGSKTDAGKERSSLNATKHGLRSERPVLPGEDPAEWDAFRAEAVASLEPVGALERKMAERVALQMWRLERAARFEVEVCTDEYEGSVADSVDAMHGVEGDGMTMEAMIQIEKQIGTCEQALEEASAKVETAKVLGKMPANAPIDEADALFLLVAAGGQLDDTPPTTAGALRRAMALACGDTEAVAVMMGLTEAENSLKDAEQDLADAEARKKRWCEWYGRKLMTRAHDQKLLQKTALDRVIRYEAHVSRQLEQALRLLRQFQADRRAKEAAARIPVPVSVPVPDWVRSVESVPEPIVRRSQLPPTDPEGEGSFGKSPETAAAPGAAVGGGEFVRHYAAGHHNGNGEKRPSASRPDDDTVNR